MANDKPFTVEEQIDTMKKYVTFTKRARMRDFLQYSGYFRASRYGKYLLSYTNVFAMKPSQDVLFALYQFDFELRKVMYEAFIVSLSDEQRVAFIDALFDILTCTDANTLTDLKEGGLRTAAAMVKKYRTLDKDTRQALGSTLRLFMKAGAKAAASELNPVQLLLRHLPLQKLAEGLESQEPADAPAK